MKLKILKSKIKVGFSILLLAVPVMLSGCMSGTEENQSSEKSAVVDYTCIANPESEKKIYVILKNYHGNYWQKVIEGITAASGEMDAAVYLGGIDNETDISGQITLMDEALEADADGILLAPANSNSLVESCEKAREDKIPLVLVDSSVNSEAFDACYMTDNIDAGKKAAKEMIGMLYNAGNSPTESLEVGIMLSSDTSQAMVNRVSGFLDYWADYAPEQWEIAQDIAQNGGDLKKAQNDVLNLLKENENIKGIFGCNNTSTIGIANTLLEEKRTDVVMVGFDLSEEAEQIIRSSDYYGVVLMQNQDQMGYLGMLSLDSFIKGESTEQKYFDTEVVVMDSDYLTESDAS